MSLILFDGFENASLWSRKYSTAGTTAATAVTGRNGNAIQLNGHSTIAGSLTYQIPSAEQHATILFGFAFRVGGATFFPNATTEPFFLLKGDTDTTTHVQAIFTASSGGNIAVYRNTSLLGTSSGMSFVDGVTYYLEGKIVLHDTTGSVQLKVNGTTILTLTNVDTKNAGTGTVFDSFRIGARGSTSTNLWVDDFYLLNGAGSAYNDFLGDITVETLRPNGDGNANQFTGSDGNSTSNYLLVDEATYDAADYVSDSVANHKDQYAYGDLVAASGSLKGVVAHAVAAKTASGAQSFRQIARISGTDYSGSSVALDTSDLCRKQVWEVNPGTAVDWTVSDVNGAQFGVEVL